MDTMKRARIVMFVDGEIGQKIARVAIDHDPRSICAVITLPGNEACARLARDHAIAHVMYEESAPAETAAAIGAFGGNIFVLAWWPLVLAREFLTLGQQVTLNLHPSLLPYGRGKDPNFWTIVEQCPFGVSVHHVVPEVDAGDIAFQREIPYDWEDTGETLYRKAEEAIVELFRDCYPRIVAFDIPRRPQALGSGSFHRRRELDPASLIELDRHYPARELINLLRARTFKPHPACRFVDDGRTYEMRISIRRMT
jgi:methionyl-tRNA formyltransferase